MDAKFASCRPWRRLPAVLSADGVHPNETGYRIMARLAERAIAEALTRR